MMVYFGQQILKNIRSYIKNIFEIGEKTCIL